MKSKFLIMGLAILFAWPLLASEEPKIVGIGVLVQTADEGILINGILPETPADRIGLQKDDIILEIDGKPTKKMNLGTAVSRLRGDAGSYVMLRILRKNLPFEVEAWRALLPAPTEALNEHSK